MKKLKLLMREFLFWVSILLTVVAVLALVLTIINPHNVEIDWVFVGYTIVISLLFSLVLLFLAIDSVNEKKR